MFVWKSLDISLSRGCWQFDLWFLCLFKIQFVNLKVVGSHVIEASVQSLSHVWLFATPWTVARQASLSITNCKWNQVSSVHSLSHVWLFATPWTAACQASLSITNSRSLLKCMSIESVMPSSHHILCYLLWLPSVFPSIRSFPVSQFFTSGGQSIGTSVSASVLPMNIQDWFPLGLTGLMSLKSKGLSRVFSNSTVPKHQFISA